MQKIAILAMNHSRLIGSSQGLPWNISEDLKRFRELTMHQVVIVGKNTYFSLPTNVRPFPNRRTIVITNTEIEGVETFSDIQDCLMLLEKEDIPQVYIAGGSQLYDFCFQQGLIDQVELTLVDGEYTGNIFVQEFRDDFFTTKTQDFSGGKFITLHKI